MNRTKKRHCIFLSAAEVSGDAHCAGLIRALRQQRDDIVFVGVGGNKMAAAGCELLENTVEHAAMSYQALANVAYFKTVVGRVKRYLKKENVDLVVVCDSPAFNFHVAKAAKAAGTKTLFYVAPQLWAWAQHRIKKLHKWCDKLCCIFPFEEDWFRRRGVDATFVGSPLLDEASKAPVPRAYSGFDANNARIALLPGSRSAEVNSLWRPMQAVGIELRRRWPGVQFVTIAVDDSRVKILKSLQLLGFKTDYATDSVYETTSNCDFSLVASGSATLQVAATGCPMVIMYQSSRLLWHLLGRWLIKTRYLSLVNILAKRKLVPEFMPYFTSVWPIVNTSEQLLSEGEGLAQISRELLELVKPLRGQAAKKTADIALKMLG